MKNIKNIIFDLGGVVIDLKRENAVAALERIGFEGAGEMLGLYKQEEPFLSLETGRLTAGEFFDAIRKAAGNNVDDKAIQDAFNEFLVAIPVARLERLRALRKKGYKVYGLSNTNPVMYHSWIQNAFRQEGFRINDYFDGIVTSFEEGTCKPDPELFRVVLRRYSLEPAQTLMLDDSSANCEAARSTGMEARKVGVAASDDMLAITAPMLI